MRENAEIAVDFLTFGRLFTSSIRSPNFSSGTTLEKALCSGGSVNVSEYSAVKASEANKQTKRNCLFSVCIHREQSIKYRHEISRKSWWTSAFIELHFQLGGGGGEVKGG